MLSLSLFSYIIFLNICIVLIFFIYINTTSLFVIIKEQRPRELHMEEDVVVQVHAQEHGANIEDQVNDPIEEYQHDNNIVE